MLRSPLDCIMDDHHREKSWIVRVCPMPAEELRIKVGPPHVKRTDHSSDSEVTPEDRSVMGELSMLRTEDTTTYIAMLQALCRAGQRVL